MPTDNDIKRNGSGCLDPTASKAIKNIAEEEERFHKLLNTLFNVCDFANFEIVGRIVLVDKKTGRVWR